MTDHIAPQHLVVIEHLVGIDRKNNAVNGPLRDPFISPLAGQHMPPACAVRSPLSKVRVASAPIAGTATKVAPFRGERGKS